MSRRKHRNRPKPVLPPVIVPAMQGDPEWTAAYSLDRQITQAREEMGAARWRMLNSEWL